jgi:uncharacterized membrane protein YphA (DoxX/SURF4 family)
MKSALRSIQQTEAGRWMLVPRLAAGLPLLLAGAAHYVRPSLLQLTLTQAGAPLRDVLVQAGPCLAIVAGLLLVLGYFGRLGAFLAVQLSLASVLTLVKLYELPFLDARMASFLPPLTIPLIVSLSAFAVLWLGSGAWSLDADDTQTTFGDADDLFTEFDFLDPEPDSDPDADYYPCHSPDLLGV